MQMSQLQTQSDSMSCLNFTLSHKKQNIYTPKNSPQLMLNISPLWLAEDDSSEQKKNRRR